MNKSSKITPAINAFQNESEVVTIGNLTLENRLDRITISGDVDITLDKVGYETVIELKRQIDAIADYMKSADLPDVVETIEAKVVVNPFLKFKSMQD